jgi:hypothetical protein
MENTAGAQRSILRQARTTTGGLRITQGWRHPRTINTKRAYDSATREIEELTMRGDCRSAAETEYYHVLCSLVAEYEQRAGADRWHKLSPIEALRELMEPKEATQAQPSDAG